MIVTKVLGLHKMTSLNSVNLGHGSRQQQLSLVLPPFGPTNRDIAPDVRLSLSVLPAIVEILEDSDNTFITCKITSLKITGLKMFRMVAPIQRRINIM